MMQLLLCLGITIAALCMTAESCKHHVLVAPQKIREGVKETVVLFLHAEYGQVNVVATVKLNGVQNFTVLNTNATKPIVIEIKYEKPPGAPPTNRKQFVELIVNATRGGEYVHDEQLKMLLVQERGYIYVQTGRPIYRPDERVDIRVTALNQKQGPELARDVEIVIEIPKKMGSVVVEKQTARMSGKFIESHYQLPEFPVLGVWTISVRFSDEKPARWATTTFEVKEYVLPTFNVRVTLNKPFVLVQEEMAGVYIKGTITSEYSYGKNVSGSYFIIAKLTRPGIDIPVSFYQFPDGIHKVASIRNGRQTFKIKATNVFKVMDKEESFGDLVDEKATLSVIVAVTGQADGVIETSATKPIPFVRSPFALGIERMSKYYTPGMSNEIKVDVMDSILFRPLKNVDVVLIGPIACGNLKCPVDNCCNGEKCTACKEIKKESDENGFVSFKINTDSKSQTLTYKIYTRRFAVPDKNEAKKTFDLHPYNSSHGSVLQLFVAEKIAQVGDQYFAIDVWHTKALSDLRYVIVSRGAIVATGVEKTRKDSNNTNVVIKITTDMVPSFRIIFHFIDDEYEVVSNSLWVDVKDECKYELEVTVPKQLAPGEHSTVEFKGPPNAVIAMSAVDRAAYFLYDKGRLTRGAAFDSLNQYDEGCVREGGENAQHVFEEAGLQLVSEVNKAKHEFKNNCEKEKSRKKRRAKAGIDALNAKLLKRAKLRKCYFDGALLNLVGTDCFERAEQVENEHGEECAEIFLKSCKIATRKEKISQSGKAAPNAGGFQAINSKERSNFEENMLWSTEKLGPDGKYSEPIVARDSITTFEFDAISLHPTEGFCVAPTQNMTIFKDIYIKLNLPYALKRMEQAFIRATVINYSPNNKKIKVQVKMDKDVCSYYPKEKFADVITLDVGANSAKSVSFSILPLRVPMNEKIEIQVKAVTDDNSIEYDRITKFVLVQPKGEIKDDVKGTHTIDLKHKRPGYVDRFSIEFNFPIKYTKGTRQCWLYPYSNFMGPIIEFDPVTQQPKNDIHNILRMPGGCGEQTMLSMGVNAMAHKYLKSVNKMQPGSAREAGSIEKMKIGFANELKYRTSSHPQVWSVFPRHAASVWLNAYVNKVFAQTKKFYVDMNVAPICISIDWLTKQQDSDGGFKTGGKIIHQEMHGAVGSKLSLSAYVMMSLVESHSLCPNLVKQVDESIKKVHDYLVGQKHVPLMKQPYTLSLVCYALTVADPDDPFAIRMRNKLISLVQYSADNRLAYWKGAPLVDVQETDTHAYWYIRKPLAIDIEATGYALLSILFAQSTKQQTSQDVFDLTRKIVLWIIEQRDDRGGFTTTQDTVVGLQALAEYMIWSNKVEPDTKKVEIDLTIFSPNGGEWFENPKRIHLDETNENTTSPIALPPSVFTGGKLKIEARGEGEGTISYRCVYRTLVEEDACHYELSVRLRPKPGQIAGDKSVMLFEIEVFKPNGAKSGQSIIEVNLLSGYEAMVDTLENLVKDNVVDGKIERYEVVKQKIIIYLSEITDEPTKIAFLISQTVFVENPEPATVKVYDYYEPSVKCTKFYKVERGNVELRTTCKDPNGVGNEDICKCAEGGCLTCRTREQQLEKTACLPGMVGDCLLCKDNDQTNCFNMSRAACKGNYVYEIKVLNDGESDVSGVFMHFKAEIYQMYKRGLDILAKNGESRTFITRSDCFEQCSDAKSLTDKKTNVTSSFIARGRTFLTIGKSVDEHVDNAGNLIFEYSMDEDMVIERIYPTDKCIKAKDVYTSNNCADIWKGKNKKQKDNKKKTDIKRTKEALADCNKQASIFQSCYNLLQLRKMLAKGCDE